MSAARHAYDPQRSWRLWEVSGRLWEVSEQLTSVRYQLAPAATG